MAQGTKMQASPQKAMAFLGMVRGKPYPCTGTVLGMPPCRVCSALTSLSHFSKNLRASKL